MTSRTRTLLIGFALLGLVASGTATWVHYHLITRPNYSSFCDINATVSCTQAYLSSYGSVGGVPVAVGGLIFFTLVLLLLTPRQPARGASGASGAASYVFALSTLGLAVALYLAYASFFILHEVCPICVATYVAVIGLFVVSGGASGVAMGQLPRLAVADLRRVGSSPRAALLALLFVGGSLAAIAWFPRAGAAAAAAQAGPPVELRQDQRSEFERWWEMQERVDVPFPRDGAKVLIVKFSDYQCPACKATHYNYAPILAKYKPEDVKFLLKQYPLNPECNASVGGMVHPAACNAAAAAFMAQRKGTLDALTDWFFAHQEQLSPASVRSAASEIGHITDFDAELPAALQQVRADAAAGGALQVGWTPTFFINGRRVPREGLPPQYFEAAIALELKKARP